MCEVEAMQMEFTQDEDTRIGKRLCRGGTQLEQAEVRLAVPSGGLCVEGIALVAAEALSLWEDLAVRHVELPLALVALDIDQVAALVSNMLVEEGSVDVVYTSDSVAASCFAAGYPVRVICSTLRLPIGHLAARVACSEGQLRKCRPSSMAREPTHGVLLTTEAFERGHPRECSCLVRALLRSSRALHGDSTVFCRCMQTWVAPGMLDEDAITLWEVLVEAGAFAVNGAISRVHWGQKLETLAASVEGARDLTYEGLISCEPLAEAVRKLGRHPCALDPL
mmetsp:Transcript_84034/g.213901  ORF Transcript_84034/g.213901 Transcript_84034/m.213901 type:complete len:280 (-) Transcript_84034:80-919(-)|eukprot:CAMPEP_0183443022 /NCGR_PEP_ID=MMETSP0370-20130417/90293_1 /TAXON_ID=268820 /ORGANISM="Peridinium aciculiferum, Strain PAER-2" /LENGTH=279 /DNA_ID=CAMNT_0025632863 /DNA_START=51 /DNA_END=890 /DNA_ORIENTATION=+